MAAARGEVPPATASVLADLGPFFAVQSRAQDPWQPIRSLLAGPALAGQVARTQSLLAQRTRVPVETRVAASVASLGLFARLIAPYLGAAAAGVSLPAPDPDAISFQPTPSQPWPLHLTGAACPADPKEALAVLVEPFIERIAAEFSLSRTILRGNAASGVFGALAMITRARPDLTLRARELGAHLLEGALTGTGTSSGSRFVRASCCLFYRIPGGGYCGDCLLPNR